MNQLPDISEYWQMVVRRKYWIIIPFMVSLLGGLAYALIAPKLWQAETLILVQAQSVPESYVQSIVSEAVDERLKTISQQVTSRTNLESIITQYRLDEDSPIRAEMMEAKVELLRKRITIGVNPGDKSRRGRDIGTSAFSIAFQWEDPRKAMQVANALASNFISENLKVRETQALGTSTFLAEEGATIEKRLMGKEEELKTYREKHMGGLPSQLDGNIKMIEGLQMQIERLNGSIRDRENRRIVLHGELSASQSVSSQAGVVDQRAAPEESRDLATLKSQLAGLEAKYTPSHPDVIRLKALIESLESKEQGRAPDSKEGSRPAETPANRRLVEELRLVEAELRNLRLEADRITGQIRMYQKWVEETPRREQELFSLNREYERLKELHSSLLKRKLEAEIAVSMEKKQKGEQFRVIDPAKLPMRPIKPDMQRMTLVVLALGLGLGGGLAYLTEMMDTSYRNPEEIEKELKLPVLMSIPYRHTEQEIKGQKRKEIFKAAGVAVGFAVSAVAIILGSKGVEATVRFIKELAGP